MSDLIVVCGSRDYSDREMLWCVMDGVLVHRLMASDSEPIILHGKCPHGGADGLADEWAKERELEVRPYPPRDRTRDALLARDREMVDQGPVLVCGFSSRPHATPGTGYTCRYAYDRRVPVLFTDGLGRSRHWQRP